MKFDPVMSIWICIVIGGCAGAILAVIRDRRIEQVGEYVLDQLSQIYFCSYSVRDIFLLRFIQRYSKYLDYGFCGPTAGVAMLALKSNSTARYVYAYVDDRTYRHCWVEFCYHGTWYVIDACWIWPFLCPRRKYYRSLKPEIIKTCSYEEFWQWPISHQFYEKMRHPETSWLLWELMQTYNFSSVNPEVLFPPNIAERNMQEETGRYPNPCMYIEMPKIIFSRRIVHEMMQRPSRDRPTAHRIRAVQHVQRQAQLSYAEYNRLITSAFGEQTPATT